MKYHCCDPRRLDVIKRNGSANAIEFIEVLDRAAPPGAPRQQTLFVRLLRPGFVIAPDNLRIAGGERIRTVGVEWCAPAHALPPEAEPGLVNTVNDKPRTLVDRRLGRFLHLYAEHRREFRQRRSALRLRPKALVDRVLVQGRVSVRLRLRAESALPAGAARGRRSTISPRISRDSGG